MNVAGREALEVGPCPPPLRAAAWELAFSGLAPPARAVQISALAEAERSSEAENLLWAAWTPAGLRAAAAAQCQRGRVAHLWPPQVATAGDEPAADAVVADLLDSLAARAGDQAIDLVESLLPTDAGPAVERLLRAGLLHLTDLVYLLGSPAAEPLARLALPFQLVSAREQPTIDWPGLIEATYEATRDCPALNHVRRTEDVVEGYRHIGRYDPGLWWAVFDEGRPVGCLILAAHSGEDFLELVYMALVPRVRGRGWGRQILRWAQRETRRAARQKILLAVDSQNEPALTMYAAAGFTAWDQRSVYWRLPGGPRGKTGTEKPPGTA